MHYRSMAKLDPRASRPSRLHGWRQSLALTVACLLTATTFPGCGTDSTSLLAPQTDGGGGANSDTDGGNGTGGTGTGGVGNTKPVTVDPASVKQTVGPEGGTLTLPSGAKLVVPAGALASPVELSMQGVTPASTAVLGGSALGQAFELGPEGQQFLVPVQLVVPFDATRVPTGGSVDAARIVIAPKGGTDFAELETTADLSAGTLTAETVHFSVIAPVFPTNPNPLFIATKTPLPDGMVDVAYAAVTFQVSGGTAPYTWTTPGAPPPQGLALSGSGTLSGTPTASGAFSFAARATDSASHRLERLYAITIAGPLTNPVPVLTAVTPNTVTAGATDIGVTLVGSGFVRGASVTFDQNTIGSTFVTASKMTATFPTAVLTTVGSHTVRIVNPAPGGGASKGLTFTISAVP
ncbi:MAG TPA: hypothetical protein VF395_09585, partial [Polyangiaceae bacterium]